MRGEAKVREAHPVTLDNSEPEPDIAIVKFNDRNYAKRHPYPQDIHWLIEVSNSTLTKDLEEKPYTYARNGIREYWVIDLPNNKLWIFNQPRQNGYAAKREVVTGHIHPVSLPNLNIDVRKLLPNK